MRWTLARLVDENAGIVVRSYYLVLFHHNSKILGKFDPVEFLIRDAKDCAAIPEHYMKLNFVQPFLQTYLKVRFTEA